MSSTKIPADVSEDETIELPIIPHFPEGLQLTFSDNTAVQHTPTEFTITFSQVRQPFATTAADYENMKSIRADVVARIVLTPSKMAEFIKVLQENWGIYQRRIKTLMEAKAKEAAAKNVNSSETGHDTASKN
jgi:hypothetical protein